MAGLLKNGVGRTVSEVLLSLAYIVSGIGRVSA